MTKNNLVKKILNYALPTALTIGSAFYSSNANAQESASNLNESKRLMFQMIKSKEMANLKGVPSYVILNQEDKEKSGEMEALKFYPFRTSIEGNNLHSRLVYKSKQSLTKDGQNVDLVKYHLSEEQKQSFKDLFSKKEGTETIYKLAAGEANKFFNTIQVQDNGTFIYFPLDEKEDTLMKTGKRLGIIFPEDGAVIFRDNMNEEYLVGNPNKVFYIELNEEEKLDETLFKEAKEKLDSLGRNFLVYDNLQKDFMASTKINGDAYKLINFPFLENEKAPEEQKKQKSPSNINGRIKFGAGVTAPLGYALELNPQIQLDKDGKAFLGFYGSYSNASKSLENITKEDGFRQVVSVPADMYFVSTGSEIKENTKLTNGLGFGLNFSAKVSSDVEAYIKAGLLGQKTEKTMTSAGEEYMEIGGVKDSSSVKSYNESNNFTEKRMSGYLGAGAEYFPFSAKENALKNISVYGEAGYVLGKNLGKGIMGSLGIKYNLNKKPKNKDNLK